MRNTLKLIFILCSLISILLLLSYNQKIKNFLLKAKIVDYIKLTVQDEINLFNFLETKYSNILLPKEIIFRENNKKFICNNLKIMTNNTEINIDIEFIPYNNQEIIGKYSLFKKYGIFKIKENKNNSDVPEIDHLSSDNSDDLNFDINDIINSDTEDNNINYLNKDTSNKEIFLTNVVNIDNNDTENNTTESIINNVL
jgi:hypothetical protein